VVRAFVDTNLWVYRLDRRDPEKSAFVRDWLRKLAQEHEIVVSTQVLIELRSVLTGKLKPAFSWRDTQDALEALAAFDVVSANSNLVLDAHALADAEKIAWFDALIVEAAIRSGCTRLFTEDLNHGQKLGKLMIINPFVADGQLG